MQSETPMAGKMALLPLRLVLRAFQPLGFRVNSFWGLGAMPPDTAIYSEAVIVVAWREAKAEC